MQPLPTPFPPARYEEMSAKSPFALATAAAPTAAPTPGFAADLYVNGVARLGTNDYVTIKQRGDDKTVIFLAVGHLNDDGLKVERVEWSDEMAKTKVFVSKAGEKATLTFDQAEMAKAALPPPSSPVQMPVMPGGRRGYPIPPGGRPGFPMQLGGRPMGFPQQPGMPNAGGPGQPHMQFRRRSLIPPAP